MGSIADKLKYMSNAIDDIQLAITENHVECDNTVELGLYGEKIRLIKNSNGNGIKDFYPVENFIAFTKNDLATKTVENVTIEATNGQVGNVIFDEYYKIIPHTAFSASEIVVKTVADVSDQYQF